jgi:branched-chain amino acid transport system ATP-binding protein
MLEVSNLLVFFENALAVNDLSLEIQEREIVGVLGSNGAGKTTLMNTIRRGGERITVLGQVKYSGEDITNAKPSDRVKKGIVLCRERHPVFPDSSVEENLKIAAYLRRGSERKTGLARVYDIFSPLKDLKKRRAGFCSGGEQQMLSIGMALMTRPRLLLMDEPLLGLSPAMQEDLIRAMGLIREEGVTILVTEQFARPLSPVIDRGYVIENGTLVLSAPGRDLLQNPEVRAAYFGL